MRFPSGNPLAVLGRAALLLSFSALPLGSAPQSTDTQKPQGDPVLGERIAGGIAFDGKLWLRGVSGGLVSLNLSNDSRQVHFASGVLDMKRVGHDLLLMRRPAPNTREVVLSIWREGRFDDFARSSTSAKDGLIALLSGTNGPTILSTRAIRVFSPDKQEWRQIKLKGKLRGGFQETAASPLSGNSIYVGFLAAVGLVHMMSHGSILRVCGSDVSLVFEKSYTVDGLKRR
jgi:hypothetical protein